MTKLRSDDGLQYPYPDPIARRIDHAVSFGSTGIIELVSGEQVKKSPHPHASSHSKWFQRQQIQREFQAYQRLPASHPRLVQMLQYSDDEENGGIILEYMPNGNLCKYLESNVEITLEQRLNWAVQAAEAVVLLHAHGIIHGDIKPENMVLDGCLGLRIIDMSGSSIDGIAPLSLESTRFFLPRSMKDDVPCNVTTDIFALGSSIYQIITRKQPYKNLEDEEVEARFAQQDFPSLDGMVCQGVINKCWNCEFESAQAVLEALKLVRAHTDRVDITIPSGNPPIEPEVTVDNYNL